MPKYHERERKINAIQKGENVRPPYNWFWKMYPTIKKQYPTYSQNELYQVLGGIWSNYPTETKIKIINEYQDDEREISLGYNEILGDRFK